MAEQNDRQQENLQNTNIIISGVEDTGPQIKIRDQNKRTYSFFKTKKDGGETAAFRNFQHFKVGDTVEIAFREVPYKEGTIKNVLNVKPATGRPEMNPVARMKPRGKSNQDENREYWEQREQKRQSSILMQVAFKSAVALEAARMDNGETEDRERIYQSTLEFYDWMASQIGEAEQSPQAQGGNQQQEQLPVIQLRNERPDPADEDLGF